MMVEVVNTAVAVVTMLSPTITDETRRFDQKDEYLRRNNAPYT